MTPLVATLRWRRAGGRGFSIWLPLFIVWLLLVPGLLVLFPLAFLWIGVNAVRLYATAWCMLTSLRRTLIEVEDRGHALRIHLA